MQVTAVDNCVGLAAFDHDLDFFPEVLVAGQALYQV